MNLDRTVINGIARHLGIPASETFKIRDVGTIQGTPFVYVVMCQCGDPPSCQPIDTDPFGGRTPTARELDVMFEGGGRVRYPTVTLRPKPITLDGLPFAWVVDGRREDAIVYCGRCPDCGAVLVGVGSGA